MLGGDSPEFRWVSATGINRFLNDTDPSKHESFLDECARRIAAAYPPNERGESVYPFNRLFVLARAAS